MRVDKTTWEKWQAWLTRIEDDLSILAEDTADFETFAKVVDDNSEWIGRHQGGPFLGFVKRGYVANACMGIRRQIEDNSDSISLARLMGQVAAQADQITFDAYKSFDAPMDLAPIDWRPRAFANLSTDGKVVSRAIVERHIAEAAALNKDIKELADRAIAHQDKRGTSVRVPLKDLHKSINHLDKIAQVYIVFFKGRQMGGDTLAAHRVFDWLEVFRHPLIEPSGGRRK